MWFTTRAKRHSMKTPKFFIFYTFLYILALHLRPPAYDYKGRGAQYVARTLRQLPQCFSLPVVCEKHEGPNLSNIILLERLKKKSRIMIYVNNTEL